MYLAYLDPGSSSQLAMAVVAGFAGLMVAVKVWWRRVLNLFRRRPATAGAGAPEPPVGTPADGDAAAPAVAPTSASERDG